MKHVVTVTFNPSVDANTSVEHVAANRKLRCSEAQYSAGGGGINMAVVINSLGGNVSALFPCGGPTGDILCSLVVQQGIKTRRVELDEWTRINFTAFEESSENQVRFVMPGPQMTKSQVQACLDILDSDDLQADFIAVSGSLPPGVDAEIFQELAQRARERSIHLCVDTSGDALQEAVRQGVYLLKPNLRELKTITGKELSTEKEQESALKELIEQGHCKHIVVSLGAAGILAASADYMERVRAPAVPIQSRVGAGDSMMAGILTGLCRGDEFHKAVRLGVAAGSAAVMTGGADLCRKEDVERLYQNMMNQDA